MRQLPADPRHHGVKAVLHTDGGARGNPGPAGVGIVLRSPDGNLLAQVGRSIGEATNNVAEYQALILGLETALEHGVTEIEIEADSELVVAQVKGEWKIKNDRLRSLAAKAESLMGKFDSASIVHVPREENADADALANEAMDAAEAGREWSSEASQQVFFESD